MIIGHDPAGRGQRVGYGGCELLEEQKGTTGRHGPWGASGLFLRKHGDYDGTFRLTELTSTCGPSQPGSVGYRAGAAEPKMSPTARTTQPVHYLHDEEFERSAQATLAVLNSKHYANSRDRFESAMQAISRASPDGKTAIRNTQHRHWSGRRHRPAP